MGAVPKKKHTRARSAARTSNKRLNVGALVKCPHCGGLKRPHRACPSCGKYK